MCILRCHTFGIRVGVAARCGVKEIDRPQARPGRRHERVLQIAQGVALAEIVEELNRKGVVVVPHSQDRQRFGRKTRDQGLPAIRLPEYQENIVLLNTGHAKLMTPYFPQADLRKVPGFENARFEDPYSGGIGNSIRFRGHGAARRRAESRWRRQPVLRRRKGRAAGRPHRSGGHRRAGRPQRRAPPLGEAPLVLPDTLCIGDAIRHVREEMQTEKGLGLKYTFSGSVYFERMKERAPTPSTSPRFASESMMPA